MDKIQLRKLHIDKLRCLSKNRMERADNAICNEIISLDEYKSAESIFMYLSVGYEVGTYQLLRHALKSGKKVYVPICLGAGIMHAHRITSEDEIIPGMYNIPTVSEENEKIKPEELDLVIVPGVCFDRYGNRLGRGGGYYDRYLVNTHKAKHVGVCRSEQLLDEIATDTHDRQVDVVVSDTELVRITKGHA